jgi:glycolate oxidase FAD binding subunit
LLILSVTLPNVAVVEPSTVEEVSALLGRASREKQRVSVRGGGTKQAWGLLARPADVVLSTHKLNAVIAHRHGDLTATIQSGATLADVNRALALHGQWLPLDPPWSDRATIGGIVATNDSGPRRHRYGAPRDLIIGADFVRADGVVAKAGGIVVKNVAGYDIARLLTGSFGSLAVIVSATFKLFPLPQASRTVVIDLDGAPPSLHLPPRSSPESPASGGGRAEGLGAVVSSLLGSQLTPTAIELQIPPGRVLVRFETIDVAAQEQAAAVVRLAEGIGCGASIVPADSESLLWDDHSRRPWAGDGAVIKLTLLPTDIAPTLAWLAEAASGADYETVGRAGVGVLLVRIGGDTATQARALNGLRTRLQPDRGRAILVRGSDELKSLVDVWGPMGDGLALMRTVKERFDPDNILNPGRGPGGL